MKFNLFLLLLFLLNNSIAQSKYWVFLNNKDNVEFNPYKYFDIKAIERREKLNINLYDNSDLPINQKYIKEIARFSDTITGQSRWFNALSCIITDSNLIKINNLPFVKEIIKMQYFKQDICNYNLRNEGKLALLKGQIESMNGNLFINNNFNGKGIRICVIDAGFKKADTAIVFKHLRDSNRIIDTWDFHKNNSNVYKYSSHGTTVLSCIAGIYNNKNIGLATESEYLLARTERIYSETVSEEEDWLMAVEWADKNGTDIINSSLAYNTNAYFIEDMDGKTSLISKAANMAARKGILVVSAAGNSGDSKWKYISTPSDADSVLTIGGINPWSGLHTSFSSYGPTSDKRMKPNISAYGHVLGYSGSDFMHETQGTSFASPLIAGFAACAWQNNRELSNMDLFNELQKSSHLFPYYDYAHGYGVPNAKYFITDIKSDLFSLYVEHNNNIIAYAKNDITFKVIENSDSISILISSDHINISSLNSEINTISFTDLWLYSNFYHFYSETGTEINNIKYNNDDNNYFYYHIENEDNFLESYKVLIANKKNILNFNKEDYKNKTLRFYYRGHFEEIKIKDQN